MKRTTSGIGRKWKSVFAVFLSVCITAGNLPQTVMASEALQEDNTPVYEEAPVDSRTAEILSAEVT